MRNEPSNKRVLFAHKLFCVLLCVCMLIPTYFVCCNVYTRREKRGNERKQVHKVMIGLRCLFIYIYMTIGF